MKTSYKPVVLFVLAGVILIFLFLYVGDPIRWKFTPPETNEGVDIFFNEDYLDYDKGTIFRDAIRDFAFIEQCKIEGFYYLDNASCDSIVYGKSPDFYALDLDAGEYFEEIGAKILEGGVQCGDLYDYRIYLMTPIYCHASNCPVFAINNSTSKIRFIMITDLTEDDVRFKGDIVSIIRNRSSFEWESNSV